MLTWIVTIIGFTFGLLSAGDALLRKRDPRAALGWIVLCLGLPWLGAALYWLLGVNRIQTRARSWQRRREPLFWQDSGISEGSPAAPQSMPSETLTPLKRLSDTVTRRPLLAGCRVAPLHNGEEAYPVMLQAIDQAQSSVYLSTYIFDSDDTGRRFTRALTRAAGRGVEVRLLIDALGERYSWPPARRLLHKTPVKVARFLPPSLLGDGIHFNLRNHRKLLVIDGSLGFTGGMNIGDRHLAGRTENPDRVVDVHFRIEGPAVAHMQQAFLEDWHFATGELSSPDPPPPPVAGGELCCRGISVGPNEDFEKLTWILIGALNSARSHVRIMTPYFIPDRPLISAINAASLRGVRVEIILPEKNNLPYVSWATTAFLWEVLRYGTRVYYQPDPFVHSKLLLVDEEYALIGSANLDPRSLRLNFEFNMEVYGRDLHDRLAEHFDQTRRRSRETTLEAVDARPLPVRLRDSFAKLFSPYL